MAKNLKVYLKFHQTEDGKKVAFVTKKSNHSWVGCNEMSKYNKKVVLAGNKVRDEIIDGVLYKSLLLPMKSGKGFVAVEVTTVQFDAKIETVFYGKGKFRVIVSFGNKTVECDPSSSNRNRSDISLVTMYLEKRYDIKEKSRVISEFNMAYQSALNQVILNAS